MNPQRLFHIPIFNKSEVILKIYIYFFSLFSTFQTFFISCFDGLKPSSISKKKRREMYALTMLVGGMLLCLIVGALVLQKNQSSFLTSISSTNSSNERSKRLQDISIFEKTFCNNHIGALPYQWFN